MKFVEKTARTVDEAVEEALQELGTTKDQVDVEVLEEGTKGLLGLLGNKPARVRVTQKETLEWKAQQTEKFLDDLLQKMNVPANVAASVREDMIFVDIQGENLGLLIGRRGQTLDSLQYLTALAANRGEGDWVRIVVDVEGYRARREETLRGLARRLADKATSSNRRVVLDPMSALERRIVHNELQSFAGVETHSEGKDPYRRVVILPEK